MIIGLSLLLIMFMDSPGSKSMGEGIQFWGYVTVATTLMAGALLFTPAGFFTGFYSLFKISTSPVQRNFVAMGLSGIIVLLPVFIMSRSLKKQQSEAKKGGEAYERQERAAKDNLLFYFQDEPDRVFANRLIKDLDETVLPEIQQQGYNVDLIHSGSDQGESEKWTTFLAEIDLLTIDADGKIPEKDRTILSFLLRHGANINLAHLLKKSSSSNEFNRQTAMALAFEKTKPASLILFLLENGFNPNHPDYYLLYWITEASDVSSSGHMVELVKAYFSKGGTFRSDQMKVISPASELENLTSGLGGYRQGPDHWDEYYEVATIFLENGANPHKTLNKDRTAVKILENKIAELEKKENKKDEILKLRRFIDLYNSGR